MILLQKLPVSTEQSLSQLNLQVITVWVTTQYFILEANCNKSLIPTILSINRKNKTIQQMTQLKKQSSAKPHYFSFLIGVIDINQIKVLVLAEQVQLVCTIGSRDIFKIVKPVYIFFDPKDKQKITQQQAQILVNLTGILEQGIFFSFSYDLTLTLNSSSADEQRHQQFNWGIFLQKDLKKFHKNWSIPIIQGFVGKLQIHIHGQKLLIFLISRRSIKRSGTQSYGRGIDQEGNVGNFVQTEQIISIDYYLFSFLQIRGSVPLFWQQQQTYGGMVKNIIIKNTEQENFRAFLKHITLIFKNGNYQQITILNLLSKKKHEKKLIQNYQYLVNRINQKNIKYAYFDIHSQCSQKQYSKFNFFLQNNIKSLVEQYQFTAIKTISSKEIITLNQQKGIIRTNCLDCIDRSNMAQLRIATLSIIFSLKFLNIQKFGSDLKFLNEIQNPFVSLYRHLWADNGDYLSKQYTGTGSTQSFAIRKGKLSYLTSIDHGVTSITRAIRNMGDLDYSKNQTIQFILGHKSTKQQKNNYIKK